MLEDYRVILVSHNKLAEGMLAALEMIAGKQEYVSAWGLMPGNNPNVEVDKIKEQISLSQKTIILADLCGGSMANAVIELSTYSNVKLITGLNLALALQTVLEHPWTDSEIVNLINCAQENIKEIVVEEDKENDNDFF